MDHHLWPVRQVVKTPPFHGGFGGSNPPQVTKWAISSAGRASALQAECRQFDPVIAHHTARWCSGLTCRPVTAEIVSSNLIRVATCGSSSVVEHNLAKVGVAGSSPVFRSIWRHSQAVRQRSAKPLSPVRFWMPPPYFY